MPLRDDHRCGEYAVLRPHRGAGCRLGRSDDRQVERVAPDPGVDARVVALAANLWLISRFGVTGAAFGILLPYVLQGILRYRALRLVFRWRNPWGDVGHPLLAALIAAVPAFACRALIDGLTGQVVAAIVFLLIYGGAWLYYRHAIADARLKG